MDMSGYMFALLFFMVAVFALSVYRYTHQPEQQINVTPSTITTQQEITQDQYERMLTTLLNANIIDFQQYNRLLVNGLPYFK